MDAGRPPLPVRTPLALAIGGALTMATCMGIGRFVYTPILPAMMAGLALGTGAAGIIASANYVGYLLGAILLSLPGIPGSRRAWLVFGLAASIATTGATGVVSSVAALSTIRFAAGLASAIGFVSVSALVLERVNAAGRPGLSAVHFGGIGTGILLSSAIVSGVERLGYDWRAMWLASAVLGLLAFAAVLGLIPSEMGLPPTMPRRVAAAATPLPSARRSGALVRMIVAYGLFGFGYIIGATFIVTIVRGDPATRALDHWVWPAAGAAALFSIAIWNALARRINPYRTYAAMSLFQASGIALSLAWVAPASAIYAAVTLGGTFVAMTAIGIVGARNLSDADPRRIIAGMTVAFSVGQIVGPLVAGVAVDLTGSFLWPSLAALAALVAGAAMTATIHDPRAA